MKWTPNLKGTSERTGVSVEEWRKSSWRDGTGALVVVRESSTDSKNSVMSLKFYTLIDQCQVNKKEKKRKSMF